MISKVDSAPRGHVERAIEAVRAVNARAPVVRGGLPVRLDDPGAVRGRRALVIEDGPTITHGSMPYGAGFVAATAAGAATIVDPRAAAVQEVRAIFAEYPHIGPVLPAVGYNPAQLEALRETIARVDADVVVAATPVDLARLIAVPKPVVRARYEFVEADEPGLGALVDEWLERTRPAP